MKLIIFFCLLLIRYFRVSAAVGGMYINGKPCEYCVLIVRECQNLDYLLWLIIGHDVGQCESCALDEMVWN